MDPIFVSTPLFLFRHFKYDGVWTFTANAILLWILPDDNLAQRSPRSHSGDHLPMLLLLCTLSHARNSYNPWVRRLEWAHHTSEKSYSICCISTSEHIHNHRITYTCVQSKVVPIHQRMLILPWVSDIYRQWKVLCICTDWIDFNRDKYLPLFYIHLSKGSQRTAIQESPLYVRTYNNLLHAICIIVGVSRIIVSKLVCVVLYIYILIDSKSSVYSTLGALRDSLSFWVSRGGYMIRLRGMYFKSGDSIDQLNFERCGEYSGTADHSYVLAGYTF